MERKFVEGCRKATLEFVHITPEIAADWLKKNTNNYRNKTASTVQRYSTDMVNGLWTVNTATIAFTVSGILIDGQHRLQSVVDSGVAIWSYVMRNCPEDLLTDPNQDKGKNRNAATYLIREGVKNPINVAGTLRCLYRVALGVALTTKSHFNLTDSQVLAAIPLLPDVFFESVNRVCGSTVLKKTYAPAVMSSAVFLAFSNDKQSGEAFVDVLSKQTDEVSSHPANVLREFCISNRKVVTETRFMDLFLTALNLSIAGERRNILRCYSTPPFSDSQRAALDLVSSVVKNAEKGKE